MTIRMPFRRDVLGLEWIGDDSDAALLANTGQAATKVGTPVLLPLRSGYAYDPFDAITFSRATAEAIFNAPASPGFTIAISFRTPVVALPSGVNMNLLNFTDGNDYCVYLAAQTEFGGTLGLVSGIEYANGDYEGASGTGPIIQPGVSVIFVRFRRASAPGARVSWFADGALLASPTYAPDHPLDAAVVAGTIISPAGALLRIGDDGFGTIYPRIGHVWIWKADLSDAEIKQSAQWITAIGAIEPEAPEIESLAWPLDVVVAAELLADTRIAAKISDRVFSGTAPAKTAMDYIVLGSSAENQRYQFNRGGGSDVVLTLDLWCRGVDGQAIKQLYGDVMRVLSQRSLWIGRYGAVIGETSLIATTPDPSGAYMHGIARYRVTGITG